MVERDDEFSEEVRKVVSGDRAADIIQLIRESESGNVTTTEVRDATDMGNDETRYQFRKLEEAGIIDKEYREDLTPEGRSPVISVSLTPEGRRAFSAGIVGDSDVLEDEEGELDEEKTPQEKVDELKQEIQEFKHGEWSGFIDWSAGVEDKLTELESLAESKRDDDEDE